MSPAAGALVLAVVALLVVIGAALAIYGDRRERDQSIDAQRSRHQLRVELDRYELDVDLPPADPGEWRYR